MKLLLHEMYSPALRSALRERCANQPPALDIASVRDLGLGGASDPDVFAAAVAGDYTLVTENVSDFTRIAADYNSTGSHHHGLIIALSSRFSRRAAGIPAHVAALDALITRETVLTDQVVYLTP